MGNHNIDCVRHHMNAHLHPPSFLIKKKMAKKAWKAALTKHTCHLCPRGYGHGSIRLSKVVVSGRIPIVIDSQYWMPYLDIPNFTKAVVHVHRDHLRGLKDILKA